MAVTLSDILVATRQRLASLRSRRRELEAAARAAPEGPAWLPAFRHADVAVVAEVKRRSPSAGSIADRLEPGSQAARYVDGGARAISVLTDEAHFGGSVADLESVRHAVATPILRKDFIIDPVQLTESRAAGASAVLLIVRAVDPVQLAELAGAAQELGLARVVEVHTASELDAALAVEPETVGVNSRDLETFEVDVNRIKAVLQEIPAGVVAVAESGLHRRRDVELVARWGADAVLVGTALVRARDPAAAVRQLTGVPRHPRA